ncbi:MAG: NTP transferase domain-containing protein [Planctomycetes bacterium]|jgi:mannose-1-phosphate guanylyltransferase|nr:NTP transferase domain-containing protein [Planctomycetota bacterium]
MRYAVIMAGGAGTRLWPLSRLKRPKQLIPLLGKKSLLELAVERLDGLFDKQNIWIITSAQYADEIRAALGQLPAANIIGEPEGRDTASAIALSVELLGAKDPQAEIAVFSADHIIRPVDCFGQAVTAAFGAINENPDALVTFGIRPTWPHTGLGYIQCGKAVAQTVREVLGFKEKPDHQTARRYVESGEHFWNSGMFVWKLQAIAKALDDYLPDTRRKLSPVGQAVKNDQDIQPLLEKIYPTLEKISIDFAVMEKAKKVMMVELKCEWLDVGSWPSLEEVSDLDESGNVVLAEKAILLDSLRNVVVSEDSHLLAVLGVDDCIVVHSKDATLVCNKSESQRLKDLVSLIARQYGPNYV